MTQWKKKLLLLGLIGVLGVLWLVFSPGCPVRALTGIPCPGCGMSRAWLAALEGRWQDAFRLHPLFWLVPVVVWLGWAEFRPFRRLWANVALTSALAGAILICYGIRLHFGWIE